MSEHQKTTGEDTLDMAKIVSEAHELDIQVIGSPLNIRVFKQHYHNIGRDNLGEGTFGTVFQARSSRTGQVVAIKKLKDTKRLNPHHLREVQFFKYVPHHAHLVGLNEMFWDPTTYEVHFSLELMDISLLTLIKNRGGYPFGPDVIVSMSSQILRGIDHIHAHQFVHRDLKPENILVNYGALTKNGREPLVVKIADFGLSRMADQKDRTRWTSYVATRWYRAPEQILEVWQHSYPVDIWSFGLVLYEIANLAPMFPGETIKDVLYLQYRALGSPIIESIGGAWSPKLSEKGQHMGFQLFSTYYLGLSVNRLCRYPVAKRFISTVLECLRWDPGRRPSLEQVWHSLIMSQAVKPHSAVQIRPLSSI